MAKRQKPIRFDDEMLDTAVDATANLIPEARSDFLAKVARRLQELPPERRDAAAVRRICQELTRI